MPIKLTEVGFEPTHPKILRPERSALDRSAILSYEWTNYMHWHLTISCSNRFCLFYGYFQRSGDKTTQSKNSIIISDNDVTDAKKLTEVGFKPTHPKILRPERSALDRSAILSSEWTNYMHWYLTISCSNKFCLSYGDFQRSGDKTNSPISQ